MTRFARVLVTMLRWAAVALAAFGFIAIAALVAAALLPYTGF